MKMEWLCVGMIVRHLVLPNRLAGSEESLTWLASELSTTVTISVMSQYRPMHKASRVPLLSRTVSITEYEKVRKLAADLGLDNGWIQDLASSESYIPDFEKEGHPFSG